MKTNMGGALLLHTDTVFTHVVHIHTTLSNELTKGKTGESSCHVTYCLLLLFNAIFLMSLTF